jgi:hypothetical protein
MTIPLVDTWTSRVYIPTVHTACIYFHTVYIHFYIMYLFLIQYIYNGISSIVFGMVHSDRTGVVFLYKHFSSWLSTFFNSTSIITNCTLLWDSLTLGASQQFVQLLQVVLLHLISLQYRLSFAFFFFFFFYSTRWFMLMFLTQTGKKI